jgi:hypothetical protein
VTPLEALQRTRDLLRSSESSVWAPEDPLEIVVQLETAIAALRDGRRVDVRQLDLLFLPTGSIQEIAMHNGWSDEYMALSSVVDTLTDG